MGFVVQGSMVRLTSSQSYIFNSILAIFGNDIEDNIKFLLTFCDGNEPPALHAIKEANLPVQLDNEGRPSHNQFNNSGFFAAKSATKFANIYWDLGFASFEDFFSGLASLTTRSLSLTKQVLDERKRLNVTINGLNEDIHRQLTKMEELAKARSEFEKNADQIKANKDFTYTFTKSVGEKKNTGGQCTTNCSKCATSCHFPCGLSITSDKMSCSAMSNGSCTVCPNKCKWDLHLNQDYFWEFKDVAEKGTYNDIKDKYERATKEKLTLDGVLKAMEKNFQDVQTAARRNADEIAKCLSRLEKIALRPDTFTSTDYLEMMVASEERDKQPGYQERIKSLEKLIENAKLAEQVKTKKFDGIVPEQAKASNDPKIKGKRKWSWW